MISQRSLLVAFFEILPLNNFGPQASSSILKLSVKYRKYQELMYLASQR
jgi:hypothetical protein